LDKYTQNGNVDIMSYFNNVFLKNIDIWGFTMIYISFYEYLYKSFDSLTEYELQFISKIKYIIVHFLYETPTEQINVSSLANELTNLNKYIEHFEFYPPLIEKGGKHKKASKSRKRTRKNKSKKYNKSSKSRTQKNKHKK
jgi:hypothetical protein